MIRPRVGKAYLIGAGPGDPKLLTLRAAEAIAESDVLLVDALVHRGVLRHARRGAEILRVGKRAGGRCTPQEEIHRLLVDRARRGKTVGRVKGGDPFVFGRGGEEAEALARAKIPWEVIPGVSSGIAAAAYAGIPLTHRSHASSVAFVTAHPADGHTARALPTADTLVFFMCARTIAGIAMGLIAGGRAPGTAVALVRSGTTAEQEVYVGTLAELARLGAIEGDAPTLAIVGDVVRLERKLAWFGRASMPLSAVFATRGAVGF